MSKVKRLMIYFTEDEMLELRKLMEEQKHSSEQSLIRQTIRDHLHIELPVKAFNTDALCPFCGPYGQLVEDKNSKRYCLNCQNKI